MRLVYFLHNTISLYVKKNQYSRSDYCSFWSYYDACRV